MKKILAIMLSVMMILCMMPGMAFAADTTPEVITSVNVTTSSLTYTGSELKPAVTVRVGSGSAERVVPSQYYKVSYANNIDVGTATATVTLEAGAPYTLPDDKKTVNFTIAALDIGRVALATPGTAVIGSNIAELDFRLMNGNKELKKGTDYTVSATNSTQTTIIEGVQSITITGTGNYTGTRKVNVTGGTDIKAAGFEIILPAAPLRYDGVPKTPTITVRNKNTNTVLSSADYSVTYTNNINAGTDVATVTVTGRGKYAGKIEAHFSILPKSIAYVSVSPIENQTIGTYPEPVIKDGSKTLVRYTDYDLTYDNFGTKGTATVVIYGIGNYEGQISKSYAVKDALISNAFTLLKTTYEYTGGVIKPEVLATTSSKYREGVDYKLIYDTSSKVESNKKVQVVGIGNYGGVAAEFTYSITPKALSDKSASISLTTSVPYNGGKAIEPSVSVVCGGRTLVKGTDYTVTYLNNTNIGTATVYIYGIGNYSGSVYKTFKILGQDIAGFTATLSQTSYMYTGTEHKPAVTLYNGTTRLISGTDYKVSYKNNKNSGTATAVIEGIGNYSGTKNVTFTIVGKEQELRTDATYYTKYLTSSDFNLGATTNGDGVIVYESSDPSVATVSATGTVSIVGTGKATITVRTTKDVKFNPETKNVYITVKPRKPAFKLTTPAKGQAKVTITKVDGATKYQVKYGRMGNYKNKYVTHKDNGYKTTYVNLNKLKSGTKYYIKVRAYKTLADGTKVWGNWTTLKVIRVK